MTENEAARVMPGDYVRYQGRLYWVNSIRTRGIAAPLFRLTSTADGVPGEDLTSYVLCERVPAEEEQERAGK